MEAVLIEKIKAALAGQNWVETLGWIALFLQVRGIRSEIKALGSHVHASFAAGEARFASLELESKVTAARIAALELFNKNLVHILKNRGIMSLDKNGNPQGGQDNEGTRSN